MSVKLKRPNITVCFLCFRTCDVPTLARDGRTVPVHNRQRPALGLFSHRANRYFLEHA